MFERLTGANHKELGFHTYIGAKNPYSVALTLGELLLDNTNPKYRPREILNDVFDRLAAYEDSGLSPEQVQELAKAKADGRLVVLPPPEESDYEGLKVKYRVYKAKDNTPVENCFVLRPEKDLAAVAALTAYAHATDNKQLAEDILNWITPDERVKMLPCTVERRTP